MTIDTDAIARELREGMEGVTPGPWTVPEELHLWPYGPDGWPLGTDSDTTLQTVRHMARCNPVNIKALLDEREALLSDLEKWHAWAEGCTPAELDQGFKNRLAAARGQRNREAGVKGTTE